MKPKDDTKRFGLDEKFILIISAVFQHHPSIESVILYGSRAKGNYRNGSDIDLTFRGEKLAAETIYEVDQELDDLLLPYSFDLSLFSDIDNPNLLDHISRVGLEFYTKPFTSAKSKE